MLIEKIAQGLTAEPWGSFTFKGWLITSDVPWPEAMLEHCLEMDTGFIVGDIGFCDILLIEDGEANTTKEQALTAVRNYIKALSDADEMSKKLNTMPESIPYSP